MRPLPKRNIGVTGFMSVGELKAVQDFFLSLFIEHELAHKKENAEPRLMAGILVSSKSINGIPNRYPGRYPKPESLRDLFSAAMENNTLNLAHYNTDTPENLVEECEQVMEVAGDALHGFQLNIRWPDPALITELRHRHPKLHLLLQVGDSALAEFAKGQEGRFDHYDTESFMSRVATYGGCFNEILLDPSGGKGQPLQADRLKPLVQSLMTIDGLGIGVAGGLSGETMGLTADIACTCPYLSIDAEGLLRDRVTDSLSIAMVESYLRAAFTAFYPKGCTNP